MKFATIIENLEVGKELVLINETYFKESILNEYLECSILIGLNFFDTTFTEVTFSGSKIIRYTFENCNLIRAGFDKGSFNNFNFLNNTLRASYFSEFEFIETTFRDSGLDLALAGSSKGWKSK